MTRIVFSSAAVRITGGISEINTTSIILQHFGVNSLQTSSWLLAAPPITRFNNPIKEIFIVAEQLLMLFQQAPKIAAQVVNGLAVTHLGLAADIRSAFQ